MPRKGEAVHVVSQSPPDSDATQPSSAEIDLARALTLLLAGVTDGEPLDPGRDRNVYVQSAQVTAFLGALDHWVSQRLRESYREWAWESLDGILASICRRNTAHEAEIAGLCILIQDQTVSPIHVLLRVTPGEERLSWVDIRLGEPGEGKLGLQRPRYGSRDASKLRDTLVSRLDTIEWVYRISRGSPDPRDSK